MENLELFILLAGSVLIAGFCRKYNLSSPLVLVITASMIAFLPFIPHIEIDSELILTLVLPPLLYSSALNISVISFRRNSRDIVMLGVLLILASAALTALIAYMIIPDLTLGAALLLGAVLAPPDAVSAGAIGRRLNLPKRVLTILLGESLINDAAALTLLKVSLTIVSGAVLTIGDGVWIFTKAVFIGIALGLIIGVIYNWGRRLMKDPVIESLIGILLPFFAYVLSEHLEGSGVLSVVAAGLFIGYYSPTVGYRTRLQDEPTWIAIDVLLESCVFALIGLQLPAVINSIIESERDIGYILLVGTIILLATIIIRIVFVFTIFGARHFLKYKSSNKVPKPEEASLITQSIKLITPDDSAVQDMALKAKKSLKKFKPPKEPLTAKQMFIVSWSGMRGVVTLAGALSIPYMFSNGVIFPAYDTIFFIAFFVTVGTLFIQGLTLPIFIKKLGVQDLTQKEKDEAQKHEVMKSTLEEATLFVRQKEGTWRQKYGDKSVDKALDMIDKRLNRLEKQLDEAETLKGTKLKTKHIAELYRQVIHQRRRILIQKRTKGEINEDVLRDVLKSLDAEELSLDRSINKTR